MVNQLQTLTPRVVKGEAPRPDDARVMSKAGLALVHRLPVSLSLPLREDRFIGAPVIAVFDNLLPDNSMIRRRIAEKVGAQGIDAFSLLAEIGRDCIGALQFLRRRASSTGQVDR